MKTARIFCNPAVSKEEYTSKFGVGYSSLYILRKDIWWCRGIDAKTKQKVSSEGGAPFVALVILNILFNYIVFLSDTRYQDYVEKYFHFLTLNANEMSAINRLRNALVHDSYQLIWKPDAEKGETGKVIYFAMTEDANTTLIEKIDETENDETWVVNINKLHLAIEDSIDNFSETIKSNNTLAKEILSRSESHEMCVIPKEVFLKYSKAKKAKPASK